MDTAKIFRTVWYLLLLGGLGVAATLGHFGQGLAAFIVLVSTYLLCLAYGLYRAARARTSELLTDLAAALCPYAIFTAYYSPSSAEWVLYEVIAVLIILGTAKLIVGRVAPNTIKGEKYMSRRIDESAWKKAIGKVPGRIGLIMLVGAIIIGLISYLISQGNPFWTCCGIGLGALPGAILAVVFLFQMDV